MVLSESEFSTITKKFSLTWKPVVDEEITPGNEYLISDKQIQYNGESIDVLKKIKGKYRIVATKRRDPNKNNSYMHFYVSAHSRTRKTKKIELHRARLIAFVGLIPDKPVARHGESGRVNNDLENLCWGTHAENMYDLRIDGTLKGEKNSSSKITNDQALAIYVLSQLNLMTSDIIATLPIGKESVSSIKNKRKWAHVISSDIESLVSQCKQVLLKQNEQALERLRLKLEKEHDKEKLNIKSVIKSKVKNALAEI